MNYYPIVLTVLTLLLNLNCRNNFKETKGIAQSEETISTNFEIKFVGKYVSWVEKPPHSRDDFYYVFGFSGTQSDYDSLLRFTKSLNIDSTMFHHSITFLNYDKKLPDSAGYENSNYLFNYEQYYILSYYYNLKPHKSNYSIWNNGKIIKVVDE